MHKCSCTFVKHWLIERGCMLFEKGVATLNPVREKKTIYHTFKITDAKDAR